MIIIRNNACYVEREDIFIIKTFPRIVYDELTVFPLETSKYVKFESNESINFFKTREDLIDYDSVCSLTDLELQQKIDEINKILNNYASRWLNLSIEKQKIFDKKYYQKMRNLEYILLSLEKYKNNKEIYKKEIEELSLNKNVTINQLIKTIA